MYSGENHEFRRLKSKNKTTQDNLIKYKAHFKIKNFDRCAQLKNWIKVVKRNIKQRKSFQNTIKYYEHESIIILMLVTFSKKSFKK